MSGKEGGLSRILHGSGEEFTGSGIPVLCFFQLQTLKLRLADRIWNIRKNI